jgi:lactoylglutathione lyase
MQLAKQHLDIGLFSNRREVQLAFWQQTVGLAFDHVGKLGGGMQQHRHHVNGSILKMNHARDPLPAVPPGPIRALHIAREGVGAPRDLSDPDGNAVRLVPAGHDGVKGIAIVLRVANRDATDHFYRHVMQFESPRKGVYQCGDSLVVVGEDGASARSSEWRGPGWRYMTVQVWDAAREHEGLMARGAAEGAPLRLLGETVRYSFVCDPDGTYIEISQRASLTGGHL